MSRTAYLLLWAVLAVAITLAYAHPDHLKWIVTFKAISTLAFLLFLEWRFPLQQRWRMTWGLLFKRDLFLLATNGIVAILLNYLLLLFAIDTARANVGVMSGKSILLQVLFGLLVFEALQYCLHRIMHLNSGPVTGFLWRTHAIHHLPQQLYVVMHAVFHPVNFVLVRLIVQIFPLFLLGFDPLAVFVFGSIIGLHGSISHLNFDLRLGPFNYLFVGPELHRYHHSAESHEAVNYGATLSGLDLLFGTFKYTPGNYPKELGLRKQDGYPGQLEPLVALKFPFVTSNGISRSSKSHES